MDKVDRASDQYQQKYAQLLLEYEQISGKYIQLQSDHEQTSEQYIRLQSVHNQISEEYIQLQSGYRRLEEGYIQQQLQYAQLEKAYLNMSGSQCWRMTKPLRAMLDAIKRTKYGSLIYKALCIWRNFGFRAVVRKIRLYRIKEKAVITLAPSISGWDGIKQVINTFEASPKKKVLLISHEFNLTGAPIAVLHMAVCLKKLGYLPVVVSPHDGALSAEFKKREIPAVVCPKVLGSSEIRKYASFFNLTIANTIVSVQAVKALGTCGRRVLWWIHEAKASYSDEIVSMLPDVLPRNISVYAGGHYAKQRLLEYRPQWKVNELLYYVPKVKKTNQTLNLPAHANGKMLFACIGMLEYRKGQDILVDAIRKMPEDFLKQAYFLFVGRECYEPNYRAIHELIAKYPKNAQYIPEIPLSDIHKLYSKIDCLVCPSREDPMPIVVTEAMSTEKLVICSENTGSAAILSEDHSGLIYHDDDPQQLCDCICHAINNKAKDATLGAAARKSYENHFAYDAFERNVSDIVERELLYAMSIESFVDDFNECRQPRDFLSLEEKLLSYDDNEKNTILLISHELSLTGAPIVLQYMAESYIRAGKQVLIISPCDGPLRLQLEQKGIPVMVYANVYYDNFLTRHAEAFELIVANTVVTFRCVERLCCARTPVLWWIHDSRASYEMGGFADILPKKLPENVTVLCGGEYAKKQLLAHYPEYAADVLYYASPDEKNECVAKYEMHRDSSKIAFAVIGQQDIRKGHDILASAIKLLTDDERSRAQFYFIGMHLHQEVQDAVDDICEKYPESVFYIPQVNRKELLSVYAQCDCIICSSRDDPLPVFVTEAMMMSKIIICSENTGSAPILERECAGVVYHNDDPKELAEQIQSILSGPKKFDTMRKCAREAYEKYFSIESFDAAVKDKCLSLAQHCQGAQKTVSVVIPTYNAGAAMQELLVRLHAQKNIKKVEVIVVDSGSKDGTPDICRAYGANVIEITQEQFSHSYARNLGAENAAGDILLFMTQDAMPQNDNWMYELIQPIINREAVAVSCGELCPEETDLYYKIGAWYHAGYLGIRDGNRHNRLENGDTIDVLRRKASLNDVTMAVDKCVFYDFGYRFSYAEDLDLGLRLLKADYQIMLLSSTKSVHGHTRPAGYYLKRGFAEAKALNQIQQEMCPTVRAFGRISSTIICGAKLLTRLLKILEEDTTDRYTLQGYRSQFEKCFVKVRSSTEYSGTVRINDPVMQWCLETIRPYANKAGLAENELFGDIKFYFDNIVMNYLENQGIVEISQSMRKMVNSCLLKQFCLNSGTMLAGISEETPLFEELKGLSEGV